MPGVVGVISRLIACVSLPRRLNFFRFHCASIFTHAQQHFRCTVTTETDNRLDVQSRSDENASRHVHAREFGVHRSRSVADADSEHGNIASAQFS